MFDCTVRNITNLTFSIYTTFAVRVIMIIMIMIMMMLYIHPLRLPPQTLHTIMLIDITRQISAALEFPADLLSIVGLEVR